MAVGTNGTSEYLVYQNDAALSPGAGAFSLLMRLYFMRDVISTDIIMNKGNAGGGTAGGVRWQLYQNSADSVNSCNFEIDDNVSRDFILGTIVQGQWQSVVAVVPATGDMELFVDGVLQGTRARTAGDIDNAEDFHVGAGPRVGDDVSFFWRGRIADLTFVKRVVSPAERAAFDAGWSGLYLDPDFHDDLVRIGRDSVQGLTPTVVGTPTAEAHPPTQIPSGMPQVGVPVAVPARNPAGMLIGDLGL